MCREETEKNDGNGEISLNKARKRKVRRCWLGRGIEVEKTGKVGQSVL